MKNNIKLLATSSYTKNKLDKEKVAKVVKNLTKKELREYIRILKDIESKNTVIAYLPSLSQKSELLERELKKNFSDKKIEFREDNSLIAGIKIIDYDNVYNLNLKNAIDDMILFISK